MNSSGRHSWPAVACFVWFFRNLAHGIKAKPCLHSLCARWGHSWLGYCPREQLPCLAGLPGMTRKISQRSSFYHAEGKMAQEIQHGNVFQDRRINLHLPQSKVDPCTTEIIFFSRNSIIYCKVGGHFHKKMACCKFLSVFPVHFCSYFFSFFFGFRLKLVSLL